ncbi:helix-turn-helix transcriptional regulator [Candidatus Methylobacter oryzae]|uniref:HTH domain-containing protein n=1 Tax=Candidatus Methylobacter oryzae TaxID=2497749 RepID=A0ABY3CB17_9GAMM|nr:MarR family transcriptional regulator [Candidatus Methylobacter oryzae]TRW94434.1 HTH domain-containing protein [Candidatus Methylobacter oryzae]
MSQNVSSRQHQILEYLLESPSGLSVDDLAKALDISRTGVQQHFVVLERDGYIKKSAHNKTAGRPVAIYVLTDKGNNYFPKQYAWFSALILSDLQQEIGPERFKAYMQKLGGKLADKLQGRFEGKDLHERVDELATVMAGLGFHVKVDREPEAEGLNMQAYNCIYHDLAQEHHDVCEFDVALMSALLDKQVEQLSCMAKGDCNCSFRIK